MTDYLTKIGEVYYYFRRVPADIAPYDGRKFVKISLKTSNPAKADTAAKIYNDYIEEFWKGLAAEGAGSSHFEARYKATVQLARARGFSYKPAAAIADGDLMDLVRRVENAHNQDKNVTAAVLGGIDAPAIHLSHVADKYWPLCADRLINKSEHQISKWKNPRARALKDLTQQIGDKPLQSLTRADALKFRAWLSDQISAGALAPGSANKKIYHVRDALDMTARHNEIEINIRLMFAELGFEETQNSRPPFEPLYIQDVLLAPNAFAGLNRDARMLVYMMADTGARECELIGLDPKKDIFLDESIPHIWIRPRPGYNLKTNSSPRKIPLVGSSLHAFRSMPGGLTRYKNADSASTAVNKYMRENDLKPTPQHSLYSLRHSFKDRLRDAGAPEEVIDELMGHKKDGPKYGRGHMLETKHKWLGKIAFKMPA